MSVLGWLASVTALAFVMAVTPGPNNVLFAASGARVGYLRTLPGLLGMTTGFAAIIAVSGAGVGALVARSPWLRLALTVGASLYLLWLAIRLWRSSGRPASADGAGAVPGWWQFATLQFANPKTWLASLAFVSGFLGPHAPGGRAVDLLGVAWFLGVVWCAASVWVLFGAALRTRLADRHWSRFNKVLALLAASTIGTFWL
ncbi:threonine/homoserine/homoserine lactone efflux protein [Prauserella shujinwangii]|uniref:Threonine/homoserine/homoserine lactone efflux protein n=1 Tax=Prauserella shujinwangii TaxID=1453103 RepID=A0A2T0M2G7_9PSEU|nr:LysE family translocator [Prauserella shujinwangii]PRX50934.1 threonine/homoserine/homoserine lactone efflux protein [Prauserella shujinwangii]